MLIKAIYFLLKLGLFNAFNNNRVTIFAARAVHTHTVDLQLGLREFNRYGLFLSRFRLTWDKNNDCRDRFIIGFVESLIREKLSERYFWIGINQPARGERVTARYSGVAGTVFSFSDNALRYSSRFCC